MLDVVVNSYTKIDEEMIVKCQDFFEVYTSMTSKKAGMIKNILFLSLFDFNSLTERNIYTDLLREFIKHGHHICVISPMERRKKEKSYVINENRCKILKLKIGNMQKTNVFEKGISTLVIETQFIGGIKKYFCDEKFDLVLYATPPVTFYKVIEYVKKRDGANSYLMLKDIFPQNAVDIGMMSKTGIKAPLYKYFRNKEKRLYGISDRIGCMSQANVDYVLKHNPEVRRRQEESLKSTGKPIVEICPNSVETTDMSLTEEERIEIRKKYKIPLDKIVFVCGGNLGKPQGIDFMLKCLHSQRKNDKVFFLIVGNGTEYFKIEHYIKKYRPKKIALYQWIPKEDYDKVVAACDVGMIFLDHRFTIPNFPSRLLSYMQAKLPILAVTDSNTDIGNIITGIDKNGKKTDEPFGWWCESNDVKKVKNQIEIISEWKNLIQMKNNSYFFLEEHYDVGLSYEILSQLLK